MIKQIEINESLKLRDYSVLTHLAHMVHRLRAEAEIMAPQLAGRTVWMINTTARGGGVAEMLPKMIAMLRELGVNTEWVTIGSDRPEFFNLTKRMHNMIHGVSGHKLTPGDRELYDAVSQENANELAPMIGPNDLLIVHDPQPLGTGALLKRDTGVASIWRCHIGLAEHLPVTAEVWSFLEPYARVYDHAVFSAPEYIPDYLARHTEIIHPGIDPLSHKNRELYPHKMMGILCNASLAKAHQPVLTPAFEHPATRLSPGGEWVVAGDLEEIGLFYRPIIVQISRWDRLKGFAPLMDAFVRLKTDHRGADVPERHRHRLDLIRLVLAGPDPSGVVDDPEALEVLNELSEKYLALPPELQRDVVILNLPMHSLKENALMVNALQCSATVMVQNSLQEGFGLTITEAMWKSLPVVTSNTSGARQQIVDRLEGRIIEDPEDPVEIAKVLDEVLADQSRERLANNAQRRVHAEFLIFTQLQAWLRTLFQSVKVSA
jgi:trehalose synthase